MFVFTPPLLAVSQVPPGRHKLSLAAQIGGKKAASGRTCALDAFTARRPPGPPQGRPPRAGGRGDEGLWSLGRRALESESYRDTCGDSQPGASTGGGRVSDSQDALGQGVAPRRPNPRGQRALRSPSNTSAPRHFGPKHRQPAKAAAGGQQIAARPRLGSRQGPPTRVRPAPHWRLLLLPFGLAASESNRRCLGPTSGVSDATHSRSR